MKTVTFTNEEASWLIAMLDGACEQFQEVLNLPIDPERLEDRVSVMMLKREMELVRAKLT